MRANCWNITANFGDVDNGFPMVAEVLTCRRNGYGQE